MITQIEASILVNSFFTDGFDETSLSNIISVLELADDQYYNDDESFLSDSDYDILHQFAKQSDPTHPYFLGIGSSLRGSKVNLPYQMGSLDQVYIGEMPNWVAKHNLHKDHGVISDKLDGASAMIVYDTNGHLQIAYSRGDGIQGADISRHLRQMPSVPKTIDIDKPFVIRGENIISVSNFPKAQFAKTRSGKPYKNPRNMVSGLMNASSNPESVYQYVDFVAYEIIGLNLNKQDQFTLLKELGFKIPHYSVVPFSSMNDAFLEKYLIDRRSANPYEIDGLVIEVNSVGKRNEMNPTRSTLNPAYAIKYKVADASNIAVAEVVDVEINISKHGYLKPRVQIKPVDLVGVTVTWATGFNMKFIVDNRIGPGAKIRITRSGDVIPLLLEVIKPTDDQPFNDWLNTKLDQFHAVHWTETGIDLVLDNPDDDSTVQYQRLVDFFDTLKVPNLGEGNLQKIFDLGFETPESIIELTLEDLSSIIGSKIIGKKIFQGIREKLTNVPMYQLMGAHPAFGRGIGVRKMKKLYEAFQGDMSKCQNIDNIVRIDGFEEKTATKICNGYGPFMEFLVNTKPYITVQEYQAPKQGNLSGCIVVFTGFRDASLEKQIENAGGKMGSSVSSKTTYVVTTNPNGSSGKLDKARSLGVKVIGIDEIKGMI